MTLVAALFVVVAFLLLAKIFRVPVLARAVFGRSRRAFRDLRDPALAESERERAVRSHAGRMLALFLGISVASAAAAVLPFGVVALLDAAGVVALDAVVERTLSPVFLLVAMPLGVGVAVLLRGRRP